MCLKKILLRISREDNLIIRRSILVSWRLTPKIFLPPPTMSYSMINSPLTLHLTPLTYRCMNFQETSIGMSICKESGETEMSTWLQGVQRVLHAGDMMRLISPSFSAQNSTHQGALDVVDKHAPSTSARPSSNSPSITNRKGLSEGISSPSLAQNSTTPGALDAVDTYAPIISLGPSTNKRKRSQEGSASPSLAPAARKRKIKHPFQLQLPQQLSPYVIIDGQPHYTPLAQAPAPAPAPVPVPVPAGSSDSPKTVVAADGSSNSNSSERYIDSNRLRQQVKNGLAAMHGINEGDKWECRLPGGVYLVECLRNELCSMQWFGETVFVWGGKGFGSCVRKVYVNLVWWLMSKW